MLMPKSYLLKIISFALISISRAYAEIESHKGIEFGVSLGASYLKSENSTAPSLHLHLTKNLNETVGIGTAFEHIFDAHGHSTLSIVFSVSLGDTLTISYMPGLLLNSSKFVNHFEIVKPFTVKNMHIGPSFEIGIGEEIHYTVGVHVGF